MATLQSPVGVTPVAYTMTLELDGLYYDLTFRFNARDEHWFVDISHNSVSVLFGIKMVHSDDLFAQFSHLQVDNSLPPGTFLMRDVTGADRDPDDTDLGDDVVMLYTEAS